MKENNIVWTYKNLEIVDNIEEKNWVTKYTRYYWPSSKIEYVKTWIAVPIWWSIFNTSEYDMFEIADFDNPVIKDILERIDTSIEKNKGIKDQMKKYLEDNSNYDFDSELYYTLLNISAILYNSLNKFEDDGNLQSRSTIIHWDNNTLSNVVLNNKAVCVEFSLIAQKFLQDKNVKSVFFSWEVLWNKEDEFWEKHTFIILESEKWLFVFDPSNPIVFREWSILPRISKTDVDFFSKIKRGWTALVEFTELLWKNTIYYWTWTWSSIFPEFDIVKDKIKASIEWIN